MHHDSNTVFLYILLSSMCLITVILNLLVIISISHFRQLHNQANLILLSLAASDLLVGLVAMPLEITLTLDGCWFLGNFMCGLYSCLNAIICSASVGNMVLISIDRYVAICDPLHYQTKITHSRITILVCFCWICSVLYNCLIFRNFASQPDRYNSCYGECVLVIDSITGVVDLVVTFIVPVTVIVVLYMRVFVVAVSQARTMRSHITAIQSGTVTVKKSELKAARTLGIVIVVFCMCLFPFYFPSMAGQDVSTTDDMYLFLAWLWNFNSCLNPVIYSLFYPWFREAVKLIVTLKILKANSSEANVLGL